MTRGAVPRACQKIEAWFVGTGISLWDVTHSDTFTPAWLFLFGVPLGDQPNPRTYFVGEARWLLDHADDISNNYQFWAGVG